MVSFTRLIFNFEMLDVYVIRHREYDEFKNVNILFYV